jgi:hypothetical protein
MRCLLQNANAAPCNAACVIKPVKALPEEVLDLFSQGTLKAFGTWCVSSLMLGRDVVGVGMLAEKRSARATRMRANC